jgi:hypothetical protein
VVEDRECVAQGVGRLGVCLIFLSSGVDSVGIEYTYHDIISVSHLDLGCS